MDKILIELVNGFNPNAVPSLVLILKATIWCVGLAALFGSIFATMWAFKETASEKAENLKNLKEDDELTVEITYIDKKKYIINSIKTIIKYIFVVIGCIFIVLDVIATAVFIILSLLAVPSSLLLIMISTIIKICG